jgi:hypothetical protein
MPRRNVQRSPVQVVFAIYICAGFQQEPGDLQMSTATGLKESRPLAPIHFVDIYNPFSATSFPSSRFDKIRQILAYIGTAIFRTTVQGRNVNDWYRVIAQLDQILIRSITPRFPRTSFCTRTESPWEAAS